MGSIPGSGRCPGGGQSNPLQSVCPENLLDRGASWATVHRVLKSWTQLKWLSMNPHIRINGSVMDLWGSVQFSCSVMSRSLQPHGLQHARPPCPSPSPRACSNSCPSSWWCHPIISSSVVPLSPRLQSFPASGSLPVSQFFESGGQCIGASASASVFAMNIQDWFPLGLNGLISLQSKGLSRVFSNVTVQKQQVKGNKLLKLISPVPSHFFSMWPSESLQWYTWLTVSAGQCWARWWLSCFVEA